MTDTIQRSLSERQHKVQSAREYLARTRQLFSGFGSEQLKTTLSQFDDLEKALNADAVRLVILGEFSRGKSSLLNALLKINLLPTAQQATTAINTFIHALPPGRTDRHIKVYYQDNRPPEEIAWSDGDSLTRWGTELEASHADIRKTLDHIDVFMDHPLLNRGLVLIDTPGLESVMQHHEQITRKAIAEAHIALWLQNTTQLGGSASEWKFLDNTLRTHFRKFITVIGWWDKVLEPNDVIDQKKPETERSAEKLDVIRANFRKSLQNHPSDEIEILTGDENLIPVSAHWALSQEPDKQRRSGIDRLADRIAALFSSGEAVEQIYHKPLQQLTHIQKQLSENLADEMQQLEADKTLTERQRELESFDQDIQWTEQKAEGIARDSREEHDRAARALIENIKRELVYPLRELRIEIEDRIDEGYIRRLVNTRAKSIRLPDDLEEKFLTVSEQVNLAWETRKQELAKTLEGLRVDYAKQMEAQAGEVRSRLSGMNVELQSLDVNFDLDFSDIEQHHREKLELENRIAASQDEIERIQQEMSGQASNQAQIETVRAAITRHERLIDNLGQQPTPTTRYRRDQIKEGGMYSKAEYGDVPYTDDSNVKAWKEAYDRQFNALQDKETFLQTLIAEEQRKTGLRMSLEKAQKKYEQELSKLERQRLTYEQQIQESQGNLVRQAMQRLVKRTSGQLDQRIQYLEAHVADAIQKVFDDQLAALQACVREQYLEPLNAKREKRAEIQELLQKGETEINRRKIELAQARNDVDDLLAVTQNALQQ